jgi:addiction module HigA family antidote
MKNPVHLGEILREDVLANLGLGVGEAASRLGISRVAPTIVLHGHARIGPNLAVRLEEAGVGTARAWLAADQADRAEQRTARCPRLEVAPDRQTLAARLSHAAGARPLCIGTLGAAILSLNRRSGRSIAAAVTASREDPQSTPRGYWPVRPSMHSRSRSAWPAWRAYSSIT